MVKVKGFYYRLVALHFIDNPNNLSCVNHKDGNKINNRIDNLEWISLEDNIVHATKTGLKSRGEQHKTSKLKNEDIPKIRQLFKEGKTERYVASVFGVCQATVRDIKRGLTWKHINFDATKEYKDLKI